MIGAKRRVTRLFPVRMASCSNRKKARKGTGFVPSTLSSSRCYHQFILVTVIIGKPNITYIFTQTSHPTFGGNFPHNYGFHNICFSPVSFEIIIYRVIKLTFSRCSQSLLRRFKFELTCTPYTLAAQSMRISETCTCFSPRREPSISFTMRKNQN